MKEILLFGAGKSATCLIEYLDTETARLGWSLTVADGNLSLIQSKLPPGSRTRAAAVDVQNGDECLKLITAADLVISLLPPHLHAGIAKACLKARKHLLTASYIDPALQELGREIEQAGLLFLCEMGLDPGIDHMSAMQLIESIRSQGGQISSFSSHCGGLVAPESDDNPWHYKISWNPRNIVQAGKAGAQYRENGHIQKVNYPELFDPSRVVEVPGLGTLSWYPNRDSLSYSGLYHLDEARTFVRTTLRYPEFCFGWRNLIALNLTDEVPRYDTDGMTLQAFFHKHLSENGFSEWMEKHVTKRFSQSKDLLEKLQALLKAEGEVAAEHQREIQDFMMVDPQGSLQDFNLDQVKTQAAATVAGQMHETNLALKQLFFLGMDDDQTLINKGRCSAMDVLQFCLEQKLALKPKDKDMIVMMHQLEYTIGNHFHQVKSTLIVKGKDQLRTAMAQTVGLPLGIAAKLILQEKISLRGLHIPIRREIYEPVLNELDHYGIRFRES